MISTAGEASGNSSSHIVAVGMTYTIVLEWDRSLVDRGPWEVLM
jgi:hypothetical protein